MCDTWVALQDATLTRNVIFAKNSDRPIFDSQPLMFYPRCTWPEGGTVKLEYLEVPQVEQTYATLGSSPYWAWGYETGINEHSVIIGNEAIFTKTFRDVSDASRQGVGVELGLLGMDLIRLALERSLTARQAVEVIGTLVEQYGQFGSGVPTRDHAEGGYDNAFILADPTEAWILEAVGKRWVARRFSKGYTSISNQPTLHAQWDLGSDDIEAYAVQKGWWAQEYTPFDFARAYIDPSVPRQVSHIRLMRSRQLLAEKAGRITSKWMMRIARDHYESSFLGGPYFDAAAPDFHTICMHVSEADFTWGHTASSSVAVLPKVKADGADNSRLSMFPVFWWTPGPPCNGCYVPFFVHGSTLPAGLSTAGGFGKRVTPPPEATEDTYAPNSYWWRFRDLMDQTKGDPVKSLPYHYPIKHRIVRTKFNALEQDFAAHLPTVLEKANAAQQAGEDPAPIFDTFTANCVNKVMSALQELIGHLKGVKT